MTDVINLNQLPGTTIRAKKRIGRGFGSGKGGHTVGRGSKGQKARGKMKAIFVGTKLRKSLVKRLPLWRGKGKLKSRQVRPIIIQAGDLAVFSAKSEVNLEALQKKGLVFKGAVQREVKILAGGELKVPLIVSLPCSVGARLIIEKAGGTVGIETTADKANKVVKVKEQPGVPTDLGISRPKPSLVKVKVERRDKVIAKPGMKKTIQRRGEVKK
jgi:large subunit ribosomal protein L15